MAKKKFALPSAEDMRAFLESPEYKKAVAERMASMEREEAFVEEASWFGTTGLEDELERELPRYLRREFGESVFDGDALKASQLSYLGSFRSGEELVHYWRIPSSREPTFATITLSPQGAVTSWGTEAPPPRPKAGSG